MTGQSAEAPSESTYLPRDAARQSRRVPGPRGQAAGGSRRAGVGRPSGRASRARHDERGAAPTSRIVLLALGLPVAGAIVDELVGSALGWAFAITAVLAAVLAAMNCTRASTWWVLSAPPLVVAAITIVAEQVANTSGSHGKLTTSAVHWAVDAFPAMGAAEVTLIAVLAVRLIRSRRNGRNSGA
ncbi:DUF6542 domain-containing protein [Streptantibioticus ferralitis]|uniref:DUF6542 domain-containing protein n=1 Tax=Streptantibioticus ferralitis TaxID=236510 RepID=A0ABT5YUH5_9ACTN|nr:DUF6542 domain-containing protein [Streptantibioticus ferralitis]MDF2255084.1 hypothetical protein [Streptantibioticus ferralitis]